MPSIGDVVDDCTLVGISLIELSAKRSDADLGIRELSDLFSDDEMVVEPEFELETAKSAPTQRFRIRVKTSIVVELGSIFVDSAVEYELSQVQVESITDEVMIDFANRVGLMALIPYIRQAIADITQRVFTSTLTMPIYRSGDLTFSRD